MTLRDLFNVWDGDDIYVRDMEGYNYEVEESMECYVLNIIPSTDKTATVIIDA